MEMKLTPTSANETLLSVALHFPKEAVLSDEQLLELSSLNQDLRFERSASGDLIVMAPTGGMSSKRNAQIIIQLGIWAANDKTGTVFDSSGGFKLPNGAVRAPDAAWVSNKTLAKFSNEQLDKYPPICPEFVIELRSPTDRLSELQSKLQEYLANGATLGWLIDPSEQKVHVYTPDSVKVLDNPEKVSGEPVLVGFELDMSRIL